MAIPIFGGFFLHILYVLPHPQFGGFSAESLAERILDSSCKLLVTAGKHFLLVFIQQSTRPTCTSCDLKFLSGLAMSFKILTNF